MHIMCILSTRNPTGDGCLEHNEQDMYYFTNKYRTENKLYAYIRRTERSSKNVWNTEHSTFL